MSQALQQRLHQARVPDPATEALLNLMVAAAYLRQKVDQACAEEGIGAAQYNVLRILRGAYPDGHPRCEILKRMVDPAPDVTRLIDRLQAQGLVSRERSDRDRRLSLTRITEKGLRLLTRLEPRVEEVRAYLSSRLSRQDCRELSRICENIYAQEEK